MTDHNAGARRILRWPAVFVLFLFVWIVFVGSAAFHEILFGIGAAAVASVAFEVVRIAGLAHFRPRLIWLAQAWRLPWYITRDSATVLLALFARAVEKQQSILRFIPYRAGGKDARAAARRALAVTYSTIPPNSVVLGIDCGRNLMLVHELKKGGTSTMTRNLGAEA